jgi:hypothetical protein
VESFLERVEVVGLRLCERGAPSVDLARRASVEVRLEVERAQARNANP